MRVVPAALTVTVTALDDRCTVKYDFTRDSVNWGDGTLVFSGSGNVRITIQDYYYCNTASIDATVIEYPEGSVIHNFTYDGFADKNGYDFNEVGDAIYNGKHGTFEYSLGFGSETLDYAYKMDSDGKISFTPKYNGTITIALSSVNLGATLDCETTSGKTTLVKVREVNTLILVHMNVTAGTKYTFVKGTGESAIYYIAFMPESAKDAYHICAYYKTTTATCTDAGKTYSNCIVCGKDETGYPKETAKFNHNIVIDEAYPATCYADGKTEGSHCLYCDYTPKKQETIKKDTVPHVNHNGICINCGNITDASSNHEITQKIDFTTGKSSDYSALGTFFRPYGICSVDSTKKCMVMKNGAAGEPYIEFTLDRPATVIVKAASTDRNNSSRFKLVDAQGNAVAEYNDKTAVTGATATTLIYTVEAAGTYRLVCNETDRAGRLMSIQIVESHTYDASGVCTGCGKKKSN